MHPEIDISYVVIRKGTERPVLKHNTNYEVLYEGQDYEVVREEEDHLVLRMGADDDDTTHRFGHFFTESSNCGGPSSHTQTIGDIYLMCKMYPNGSYFEKLKMNPSDRLCRQCPEPLQLPG